MFYGLFRENVFLFTSVKLAAKLEMHAGSYTAWNTISTKMVSFAKK